MREGKKSAGSKSAMGRMFSYIDNYRWQFILSVSSSISNKVLDLMPPLLVGWIVDSIQGEAPAWITGISGTENPWSLAALLASLGIIIFALESFFEWGYSFGFMNLAQRLQHDLRNDAYRRLQRRELAFFENNRTGDSLAVLNDDINQLERFFNTGFNDILQLVVLFVFAGIILFGISWQLALVGMIPLPLILLGSLWYQKKIAPRYKEMRESVGRLNSRLENNISGIAVIKSFTAEKFESDRVEEVSEEYKKANQYVIRLATLYTPLIRMLIALGFGGVLLIGSYWVLNDMNGLSIGNLVLFSMMIQRLLWPVTRLGVIINEYARAKASAERVFDLMDAEPQIKEVDNPHKPERVAGAISFNKVNFSYANGIPVLNSLDVAIKAGERIGIAGFSGSGKSTLVKLLLRYYDVSGGSISLDGKDIREMSIESLRRQIALVSQDVYLFHGTIRDNIAYGRADIEDSRIIEAGKLARLHDFVEGLPDGYETLIGERGLKLSGGQRQRLSIARALVKNAPIIVLDEATSSVDTETERAIQENLDRFTEGKTALIIAHRLSTIRNANRILVLGQGSLCESGSHDELLAQKGLYADLWAVQTGDLGI